MPRGKAAKINRAIARKTIKKTNKDGSQEKFKNVTEARAAGILLPTAEERAAAAGIRQRRAGRLNTRNVRIDDDND